MKQFLASLQWQVEAVSQKLKPKMASVKHKQSKTKRDVAAPKKASHKSVPSIFFRIARRTSKHMARQLKLPFFFNQQNNTCFFLCPIRLNSTVIDNCLYLMLALRRYIHESPKCNIFPKLEMDSRNYPLPPLCQCWQHKREKSNAPVCPQSKRPFVYAKSNIEIPGARGYTSSNN